MLAKSNHIVYYCNLNLRKHKLNKMKKLIYTVLGLLATSAAFSQSLVQGRPAHNDLSGAPISKTVRSNSTMGKAQVSDWYDPIDWLNSFTGGGGTLTTFVDFLMPDSTAIYVNENDSIFRFYSISVGQVIDPRDAVISLTDNPGIRLSKFNGFSLDSVYLSYLYVRNVDSIDDGMGGKNPVVDTLIIRYFTPSAMTFRTLNVTPPFSYIRLNWSIPQLRAIGFVAEQKIPLTRADSTSVFNTNGAFENSWGTAVMRIATPTGISIPAQNNGTAQNVVAYTMHFKPGMSYDTSSVMIYRRNPTTFPSSRKRVNYFGYRYAQNAQTATQWRSTTFFNHSIFSDKENAYFPSNETINNGWDGYIPGNAYFAGRNIFSGLHMTSTDNVGLKKFTNEAFALTNVFPNPAPLNSVAVAGFNLKQAGRVKISIINIVGQEVKRIADGSYAAGETEVNLDLNGLNAGIYFVKMTMNGISETRKLTIGQ